MKAKHVTPQEAAQALKVVNQKYNGNIVSSGFAPFGKKVKGIDFTLGVVSSRTYSWSKNLF